MGDKLCYLASSSLDQNEEKVEHTETCYVTASSDSVLDGILCKI